MDFASFFIFLASSYPNILDNKKVVLFPTAREKMDLKNYQNPSYNRTRSLPPKRIKILSLEKRTVQYATQL